MQHKMKFCLSNICAPLSGIVLPVLIFACLLFVQSSSRCQAEDPLKNKISLMIISSDGLFSDIEFMVNDLAGRRKIWKEKIEENIELFTEGVDTTKPIRIDVFFDQDSGEIYRPFFPVSDLDDFRFNVDSFGIVNKRVARDVYELRTAYEGHMKITTGDKYAIFAPTGFRSLIDPKNKKETPVPEDAIQPLLDASYDAGIIIDHTAEDLEERKASLEEIRENILAGLKKKSTESVEEFEFRKLLTLNQLQETERLYGEIQYLEGGWITDTDEKSGTGKLVLSGIEGTELAETLAIIPTLKTRFHQIPETENFIASARMLMPLSESHQERISSTLDSYLPVAEIKIDRKDDLNDQQKTAAKECLALAIKMAQESFTNGVIDGFVEMKRMDPADRNSKLQMVAGLRTTAGEQLKTVLAKLPEIRDQYQVELETETVEEFQLHQVKIEDNLPPVLKELFPLPCPIFVATSNEMVLFSIGDESKDWLMQSIEQVVATDDAKATEKCIDIKGYAGPFAKALSARETDNNLKEFREAIIEAFSDPYDDDYIEMSNQFVDGQLLGEMSVEPGLLRFIGIVISNFAEENL